MRPAFVSLNHDALQSHTPFFFFQSWQQQMQTSPLAHIPCQPETHTITQNDPVSTRDTHTTTQNVSVSERSAISPPTSEFSFDLPPTVESRS